MTPDARHSDTFRETIATAADAMAGNVAALNRSIVAALEEIDRQHAALTSRRSWCQCGDEIRPGTLNAEGCRLTTDGWECGTCVAALASDEVLR